MRLKTFWGVLCLMRMKRESILKPLGYLNFRVKGISGNLSRWGTPYGIHSYKYICTHMYKHAYNIHMYKFTYTLTCAHTHAYSCAHTYVHACAYLSVLLGICMHAHVHAFTQTCVMYSYTHIHSDICIHTYTYIHMYAPTHMHTFLFIPIHTLRHIIHIYTHGYSIFILRDKIGCLSS